MVDDEIDEDDEVHDAHDVIDAMDVDGKLALLVLQDVCEDDFRDEHDELLHIQMHDEDDDEDEVCGQVVLVEIDVQLLLIELDEIDDVERMMLETVALMVDEETVDDDDFDIVDEVIDEIRQIQDMQVDVVIAFLIQADEADETQ